MLESDTVDAREEERVATGFDETGRLSAVRDRMERFVAAGELDGMALAVAAGGKIVAEWYAGRAAPERPAGEETLWPLASISKVYTAAAMMALVERGDLTLALPVRTLLPAFDGDGREQVRLGHLLTHTSGLIYESPRMEALLRARTPLETIVDEAYTHPLLFAPGTKQSYSDYGYALAGRMAEAATGTPFPELVRSLVLAPAGLRDTFLPPGEGEYGRMAHVAGALAEGTEGAMYNSPYALALAHPAFGVVASARDLLRFGLLFAPHGERRILSEATIAAMTTPRTNPAILDTLDRFAPHSQAPWGLGFSVGGYPGTGEDLVSPAAFGHDGASGCALLIDPTYDLALALASNRHVLSGPDRWHYRIGSVINGVLAALTR